MFSTGLLLLLAGAQSVLATCKCTPTDDCWPSVSQWKNLNASVGGQLISNTPIAKACYPGPGQDPELCQDISAQWTDSLYQESSPIGYSYPLINSCPPTNASVEVYGVCDLGNSPVYSINATKADHVAAGIKFAKENNVRLVIKNTGHDATRRSQGYGSLMVWIKHIQDGIHYQESYKPSDGSCASNWTGSAITIGGGYVWKDVYDFAAKHGRIAIGGEDPTVGAIGGYMQGGGHGPATHVFGLATDQVLEYKVVLASGEVVTANACQYTDLFTALRGGGGGTYGVVVSATVKAHQTLPVLAHTLDLVPLNGSWNDLVNTTAGFMSKYSMLADAGWAGYGKLTRSGGQLVYHHTLINILDSNSSANFERARKVVEDLALADVLPLNMTTMVVLPTFTRLSSYGDYTSGDWDKQQTVGSGIAMASRFFGKESLIGKQEELFGLLQTLISQDNPGAHSTVSEVDMGIVGGGQVLQSAPHTSVNSAWRKSYICSRQVEVWPKNADLRGIQQVKDDLTFRKLKAMKDLTPGMGAYMNEADGNDPDWKQDWFGDKYDWLKSVKQKYDPDGVFWCSRCVGNEGWEEVMGGTVYGPLCQT